MPGTFPPMPVGSGNSVALQTGVAIAMKVIGRPMTFQGMRLIGKLRTPWLTIVIP